MVLPGRLYVLAEDSRREYEAQLERAAGMEAAAAADFAAQVASVVPGTPADEVWAHFHSALSRVNYSCRCATTRLAGPGQGLEEATATA
jgi:hypothetical protein